MLQSTLHVGKAPLAGRFLFAEAVLGCLALAALLLGWLAPNHYLPWTSFHGEAAAFAALCLLAASTTLRSAWLRPDGVTLGALVVLGVILLQWALGQIAYAGDAALSALFVAGFAIAYALGRALPAVEAPRRMTLLAGTVVAAACISVFIGLLQWQHLEQTFGIFAADRGPDMRVYGNLAQPNHLATLCLMGVVFALWLRQRAVIRGWQFVLLVAWLSFGLTITESRSGLLGAVVVGGVLFLGRRMLPGAPRFVAAWWAGLALGYLLLPRLNALLLLAPARTQSLGDDNQRLVMWRQALAAIGDAPWLGHGWRQTMYAMKQAAAEVPGILVTDYAHNLVLDVLIWVGIPLGILMLSLAAAWLLRRWRRIVDARELLLFAAVVPALVHSQFEFPFAYAYFLFPVAWLLGALAASQANAQGMKAVRPWPPATLSTAVLLGFTSICLFVAMEYVEVEEDYRGMRFELRRVGQVPTGYSFPQIHVLTQLRDVLEMGRVEPKAGLSPEVLERLQTTSEHNGWATLDLNYALALAYNGQPEEASRRLAQLQNVYGRQSAQYAYGMFRAYQAAHPGLERVRVP
jgi:O-antigen ligase